MSSGGKRGGGRRAAGERGLAVRLRTAKRRTASSARWLERQLNDPYVARAKRDGYRSRAAYKLTEIDDKHRLLRPGQCVVDLGAAPGGWSQVAARRVRADTGEGKVVVVDLAEMEPLAGVTVLQLDFMVPEAPDRLRALLEARPVDVVLSDMATPATGHRPTDHLRIVGLCEAALDFAQDVLAPGGAFLAKVLQGGTEKELLARMKRAFRTVRHAKPGASRAESAETYVLAQGFRGTAGERG